MIASINLINAFFLSNVLTVALSPICIRISRCNRSKPRDFLQTCSTNCINSLKCSSDRHNTIFSTFRCSSSLKGNFLYAISLLNRWKSSSHPVMSNSEAYLIEVSNSRSFCSSDFYWFTPLSDITDMIFSFLWAGFFFCCARLRRRVSHILNT